MGCLVRWFAVRNNKQNYLFSYMLKKMYTKGFILLRQLKKKTVHVLGGRNRNVELFARKLTQMEKRAKEKRLNIYLK